MKLLVFSDSHGRYNKILDAINDHRAICDAIIFLGDGISDISAVKAQFPELTYFFVKGNCDVFRQDQVSSEATLVLEDRRVFITHGHKYGVKGGIGNLLAKAVENEADLVLFGHTHRPFESVYEINARRIRLFNPGSIADGSYGVIDISNNAIICGHGKT